MRKIDVVMAIWKEEREFFFYEKKFSDITGIEFFLNIWLWFGICGQTKFYKNLDSRDGNFCITLYWI